MIVLAIKMRILKGSFDFDDDDNDMAIPLLDSSSGGMNSCSKITLHLSHIFLCFPVFFHAMLGSVFLSFWTIILFASGDIVLADNFW